MSEFFLTEAQRHRGTKILYMFVAVLLFIGCSLDDDELEDTGFIPAEPFIPVGEWIGPDDWGDPDKYIITDTTITYVDPYDFNNFAGTIISAVDFSSNAGVIIVQILGTPVPDAFTSGKYTCIYYMDYTSSRIKLAPPFDVVKMNYVELNTLNEAISIFTVDAVNTHVSFWGDYSK